MGDFIKVTIEVKNMKYEWVIKATENTAENISKCIECYIENYIHKDRITRNDKADYIRKTYGYY